MNKGAFWTLREHSICVFRRDFNEIAEDIIMFDFQRRNICEFRIIRLQPCNEAARVISQGFQRINFGRPPQCDKPAVTGEHRHLTLQGFRQVPHERRNVGFIRQANFAERGFHRNRRGDIWFRRKTRHNGFA